MKMCVVLNNGERHEYIGYQFDGIANGDILFSDFNNVSEHGPEGVVFDLADIRHVLLLDQDAGSEGLEQE
jgi:hypothetical protein